MQQTKVRMETPIAFVMGLIAGGGTVGFMTLRQVQSEHRRSMTMANALQQSQAGRQGELIRAHSLLSSAIKDARSSKERAQRAEQAMQHQPNTEQTAHPTAELHTKETDLRSR